MKTTNRPRSRAALFARAAAPAIAIALFATGAHGQDQARAFHIQAQPLSEALLQFSRQADIDIVASESLTQGVTARAVDGSMTPAQALDRMLAGAGLKAVRGDSGGLVLVRDPKAPQSSSADPGAQPTAVDELIVTAQKKEERIQDVPIAISAFSKEALESQKIEGGYDLLKAIPNVTFSKNNFSGYNFSIRGIGTKAVSATTDPAVAVSFNNTALLRNRLFEQEYFDVERVEVLRGPQGTLYGRNATGGVINVISARPADLFEGSVDAEVGNYDARRLRAMLNVPLGDSFALRLAGSMTERDGYGYNDVTKNSIDGRALWSTRLSAQWTPTDRFRANFIWERFSEDDNRARTSKQLCHRDPGLSSLPGIASLEPLARAIFSQGCLPGSLYDKGAFGTPNGDSLPYVLILKGSPVGYLPPDSTPIDPLQTFVDPYASQTQSRDLRTISSALDPSYEAQADVFELNIDFELTPSLTLVSQTTYNKDRVYSIQDYNRFNTAPVFNDTAGLGPGENMTPGGVFTDPQLGSAKTIVGQDISSSDSRQFSQEFRVQSAFSGAWNFSAGVNYMTFDGDDEYYVFNNLFTYVADFIQGGTNDPTGNGAYIDPNPVESIDGKGANYYRSRNPYSLKSAAAFGEAYWQVRDDVKITAGLRYTDDRKNFELWPTQLLNAGGAAIYRKTGEIEQHWGEFSGRLGVDWKPVLSFTDQTMVYGFYSHGYKAGGANPPNMAPARPLILSIELPVFPTAIHPETFDPEFVDAFEVGAKNTLLGGALVLNATGFFYDYKDYQVSQIVDRLALNENFDATIWGAELEAIWQATPNLRFNANLGYLDTRIADGEKSIDVMDRTQGNEDWVVIKNWIQFPSNCIVPKAFAAAVIQDARNGGVLAGGSIPGFVDRNAGVFVPFFTSPCVGFFSPVDHGYSAVGNFGYQATGIAYDPMTAPNMGAGFDADLSGNELPNSPHWTFNLGAEYSFAPLESWKATVRADYYRQSESFARVYNTEYDRLRGWDNVNLRLTMHRDDGLTLEAYVKNVFDNDPITDAFLNSDDSGLTTNVFVLDPRLIGVSVRKDF
jgi:iron complex outermembrane receptor protein